MADFHTPKHRKLPARKKCRYPYMNDNYAENERCIRIFAKRHGLKPYQVTSK